MRYNPTMPVYAVERRITIGNRVVLGRLGPDLPTLERSASVPIILLSDPTTTLHNLILATLRQTTSSSPVSITKDSSLSIYKGRVGRGIANPGAGTKYINYYDPEFGHFGVRFSERYDSFNICSEVGQPINNQDLPDEHSMRAEIMLAKVKIRLTGDGIRLSKEEINKPPVSLLFRYHPCKEMTGSKILLDHVLPG